ncbi:MAG: hypothetical protein WKF89_02925 [Chitinophagaceae bacterium]
MVCLPIRNRPLDDLCLLLKLPGTNRKRPPLDVPKRFVPHEIFLHAVNKSPLSDAKVHWRKTDYKA